MEALLTRLQVRIRDAGEAAMAAAAGIDGIEVVVDDRASLDAAALRDIRHAFPGVLRLRLAGRHPPAELASGVDELAAAAHDLAGLVGVPPTVRRVAIVPPSQAIDIGPPPSPPASAVMLDAGAHGRLIDVVPIASLDAFAATCRARRLDFGFCGGLEAPDVSRLLLLEPDILAFETAVRRGHAPEGALDPQALDAIRALVPRTKAAPAKAIAKVTDRVFVRGFEVSLAIGAYQAEHGKRQRVRFSIVADTIRAAGAPHDMRDVFSYDIMIETIRVLSDRPHVTFVETLAEEVAASILAHVEVASVTVTVEKLDVIDGSVGIEITRCRGGP